MDKKSTPMSLFRQTSGDVAFYKTNQNDYVNKSLMAVCPLNKAHVMKSSKLQYHLVQCLKTYTGTKVPCPYNHCEYFEPEDMKDHLPVCPSRAALEVHRYNSERIREATNNTEAFCAPVLPGKRYTDEDWDED